MITTDFIFQGEQKVFDNKITFHSATNLKLGSYFARKGFEDLIHADGKEYHPTFNKLVKGSQNFYLLKGSVTQYAYFNADDVEAVEQYRQYVDQEEYGETSIEVNNNQLITVTSVNYDFTDWKNPPGKYHIEAEELYLETSQENSSPICVIRLEEDVDAWITELVDIRKGKSKVITKEGNHCYVVFGGSVNKGGIEIESFKMFKLTSDSIEVVANEDTRVFRTYRD